MATYYTEYTGYLCERYAGIVAPDMSATVEHFWSSGACDPIESTGQGPRYTAHDVDVPEWLIAGLTVNCADDVQNVACRIASGRWDDCELYRALRYLTIGKPGKFARSLIEQYSKTGTLSKNQVACVLNPPKWNKR